MVESSPCRAGSPIPPPRDSGLRSDSVTPPPGASPASPPAKAVRPLSLPARAADGLVWLYQKTVSPALAAAFPSCGCRFSPTCSHYARLAIREHGLLAGGTLAARRVLRCAPWHPGGHDPVPPAAAPITGRFRRA